MSRDRSLYFGQLEADGGRPGLALAASGGLAMLEEHAAIRQDLMLLLLTRPGERVMRPGYGCDLHRLVFWPNDDTTAGLAIHYIRQAIETWEPRVTDLEVDAARSAEAPGRLDVRISYRVRHTQRRDGWHLTVDLREGVG
ncbi:GPW/gp25 family protein [Haliangium sp.]|uniref:GPW/gp25 family protein n=1 Tax=Haliangium sp. TaxID=2663208 RepID=UPI003D1446D6